MKGVHTLHELQTLATNDRLVQKALIDVIQGMQQYRDSGYINMDVLFDRVILQDDIYSWCIAEMCNRQYAMDLWQLKPSPRNQEILVRLQSERSHLLLFLAARLQHSY